ncbi:emerin (Emery-Dreifuss muscular dystrophy) [Dunckerocampus dactyliophorus]|uniref:emerin (Emery-Dreifuss muscular dystrophy) n=1 Tax=Dunckerocampus dactyliophorus TaxID=161453 RepID=UPI0024077156|nr:emerin (Emery-Dreifuss muscular dystrophy) [Dunckerocampus dactyliophorus]
MSLSEKSDDELSKMLSDYGIKHGPIVDSTRKLYVKKLENAMEQPPVKASSDKTYYREEEEEITYITYHSPVKHEGYTNTLMRRRDTANEDEESHEDMQPIRRGGRAANQNAVYSKEAARPGCSMWGVMKMLLLIAVLAAAYYAYCHVVNNDENPFKLE